MSGFSKQSFVLSKFSLTIPILCVNASFAPRLGLGGVLYGPGRTNYEERNLD